MADKVVFEQKVTDKSETSYTLEVRVQAYTLDTTDNSGGVEISAHSPGRSNVSQAFSQLIGEPFTLTVSRTGRIEGIEDLESILDKIEADLPANSNPYLRNEILVTDYFKKLIKTAWTRVEPEKVKKGENLAVPTIAPPLPGMGSHKLAHKVKSVDNSGNRLTAIAATGLDLNMQGESNPNSSLYQGKSQFTFSGPIVNQIQVDMDFDLETNLESDCGHDHQRWREFEMSMNYQSR